MFPPACLEAMSTQLPRKLKAMETLSWKSCWMEVTASSRGRVLDCSCSWGRNIKTHRGQFTGIATCPGECYGDPTGQIWIIPAFHQWAEAGPVLPWIWSYCWHAGSWHHWGLQGEWPAPKQGKGEGVISPYLPPLPVYPAPPSSTTARNQNNSKLPQKAWDLKGMTISLPGICSNKCPFA